MVHRKKKGKKRGPQRIYQLTLSFMVNKRQSQDWDRFSHTKSHALDRRKRKEERGNSILDTGVLGYVSFCSKTLQILYNTNTLIL